MSNAPAKPVGLTITLACVAVIAGCLSLAFAGQVITHVAVKESEFVFTPAAPGSAAPAPAKAADKPKSADASKKEDPKAPNSPLKVIGSGAVQVGTLE